MKAPQEITHTRRLVDTETPLRHFLDDIAALGPKLGPVLLQLPPSLAFDPETAGAFFRTIRDHHPGPLACEPRHPSWFTEPAATLLTNARTARVAADPARTPEAATPGGWPGLVYHRLHGAPRIYASPYGEAHGAALAPHLIQAAATAETWCIFDNTLTGAAAADALALQARLPTD